MDDRLRYLNDPLFEGRDVGRTRTQRIGDLLDRASKMMIIWAPVGPSPLDHPIRHVTPV